MASIYKISAPPPYPPGEGEEGYGGGSAAPIGPATMDDFCLAEANRLNTLCDGVVEDDNQKTEKVKKPSEIKDTQKKEYIRLTDEIRDRSSESSWSAVEALFQAIIELPSSLIEGIVYYFGMNAAKNLGNVSAYYDRAQKALPLLLLPENPEKLPDSTRDKENLIAKTEVPIAIAEVKKGYSYLKITLPQDVEYVLVPSLDMFDPMGRVGVQFANEKLKTDKSFEGFVPVKAFDEELTYTLKPTDKETEPLSFFNPQSLNEKGNETPQEIRQDDYVNIYANMLFQIKQGSDAEKNTRASWEAKQDFWRAADEIYNAIISLAKECDMEVDPLVYWEGQNISFMLGESNERYERFKLARNQPPNSDSNSDYSVRVEGQIDFIEANYARVKINIAPNSEYTLEVNPTPTDDEAKRSIAYAQEQLQTGVFVGLLPLVDISNAFSNLNLKYTLNIAGLEQPVELEGLKLITEKGEDKSYQLFDFSNVQAETPKPALVDSGLRLFVGVAVGATGLNGADGKSYSGVLAGLAAKGLWVVPLGHSDFVYSPQVSVAGTPDFLFGEHAPLPVNLNGFIAPITFGYETDKWLTGAGILLGSGLQPVVRSGEVTVGSSAQPIEADRIVQTPITGVLAYLNYRRFFVQGEWQRTLTPLGIKGTMKNYPEYVSGAAFSQNRGVFTIGGRFY